MAAAKEVCGGDGGCEEEGEDWKVGEGGGHDGRRECFAAFASCG